MKSKILVIDDDPDILEAVRVILEDDNYEVTTQENPEAIAKITQQNVPDLIILDILLSGVDGREVCKSIKANPATANVPVIMISAHMDAKNTVLSCGADGFIAKPFAIDELLDILKVHLNSNVSKEIN